MVQKVDSQERFHNLSRFSFGSAGPEFARVNTTLRSEVLCVVYVLFSLRLARKDWDKNIPRLGMCHTRRINCEYQSRVIRLAHQVAFLRSLRIDDRILEEQGFSSDAPLDTAEILVLIFPG